MHAFSAAVLNMRCLLALMIVAMPAWALDAGDAGTFVALDPQGQPIEKVLRVSQAGEDWKFEDRQSDGSWLDVSCHGGCQHHPANANDLVRIFGSPPPPHLKPDCVYNNEYAFCHILISAPVGGERYALVVKIEDQWLPFNLVRVPDEAEPLQPELEAAGLR